MQGRVCLVTGANRGLGKEIALGLAAQGAQVLMVCRNLEKGRAAQEEIKAATGSSQVALFQADLSSQASLRALAHSLQERYTALHVLIHNAAVLLKEKSDSVDHIELTLATNYLGPFLLNQLLLDLLQAGAPSRIIHVSSVVHHWARLDLDDLQFTQRRYQWFKAYSQSKLLLNVASFELARRLHGCSVTVNCLDPGAINTALFDSKPRSFLKNFFSSPRAAASAPLYLATAPALEKTTGKYFVKCEPRFSKAAVYQAEEVGKLWELSERLVGLKS